MIEKGLSLRYYKRPEIQKAILKNATSREVAVKYGKKGFGKRPDALYFPADILEFAKKGVTSFHVSEEIWENPLHLDTNMKRKELNELRVGWDLIIDIDSKNWRISKIIAHLVIKSLRDLGINSITIKFSGNKGFHIGVPYEVFKGEGIKDLFPELPKKIAEVLLNHISKNYIKVENNLISFGGKEFFRFEELQEIQEGELTQKYCSNCHKKIKEEKEGGKNYFICPYCEIRKEEDVEYMICPKCNRMMEKIKNKKSLCSCGSNDSYLRFNPLSVMEIDTLLISSRHMYRCSYSLHEKSSLASIVINPEEVLKFNKEQAKPDNVIVSDIEFLDSKQIIEGEGKKIIALAKELQKEKEEIKPQKEFYSPEEKISEEFFPPCINKILEGLSDGKKRALFVLVNFLRSVGWGKEEIEATIKEWNKKNPDPLKESEIVSHLRYHLSKKQKVLPPNCVNNAYYKDLGICVPDTFCPRIKNPVTYTIKKEKFSPKKRNKKQNQKKEEHL